MLSLATALFTAALALFGKILFDLWGRHREQSAIAGALVGEIGAYIDLLNPPVTSVNYRAVAGLPRQERLGVIGAFPALPTSHPVFDRLADKIGSLPHGNAEGVSRIYTVVTGVRLTLSSMSSQGFLNASDVIQQGRLSFIADTIEREGPKARDLIASLRRVSEQTFWCFFTGHR